MIGFTQTPNEYFDTLLPQISSLAELKVLSVAIRKTYGWQKEQDRISVSQFMELTGMSRVSVVEGLRLCLKRGTLRHYGDRRKGFTYAVVLPEPQETIGKESLPIEEDTSKESVPIMVKEVYHSGKESVPIMVKNLYPQNKDKQTNSKIKNKDNSSDIVKPITTPLQQFCLQSFNKKILNPVQRQTIVAIESEYGYDIGVKAATWMANKGMKFDANILKNTCKTFATGPPVKRTSHGSQNGSGEEFNANHRPGTSAQISQARGRSSPDESPGEEAGGWGDLSEAVYLDSS